MHGGQAHTGNRFYSSNKKGGNMPKVGKKEFSYSKKGIKKAKKYARKTGEKMMMSKKRMVDMGVY